MQLFCDQNEVQYITVHVLSSEKKLQSGQVFLEKKKSYLVHVQVELYRRFELDKKQRRRNVVFLGFHSRQVPFIAIQCARRFFFLFLLLCTIPTKPIEKLVFVSVEVTLVCRFSAELHVLILKAQQNYKLVQ